MDRSFSISGNARVYLGEGGPSDFDCPVVEVPENHIQIVSGIKSLCRVLGQFCSKYRVDTLAFENEEVGAIINIVLESDTTTVYLNVSVTDGSEFTKDEHRAISKVFY